MINNNHKKEQLLELYNKTPKDIQNILLDKNLGPAIHVVGEDHGLTALQSLEVEDEVVNILLGISKQGNLARNIVSKLNISSETADKIVSDIDENILLRVKEYFAKISGEDKDRKKIGVTTKVPLTREEIKKIAVEELTKPTSLQPPVPQPTIKQTFSREKDEQDQPTPDTPPIKHVGGTMSTPTPPKHIVGEEKIGVDVPPSEHIFEKKLRNAFETPKEEKNATQPTTETQQPKTKQDPYREPLR